MTETASLELWRQLALRFHAIRFLVSGKRLPEDFTPKDFAHITRHGGVSSGEHRVMMFLLHTWNPYDNPFEMGDVRGWDDKHLEALCDWLSGRATGQAVHYF